MKRLLIIFLIVLAPALYTIEFGLMAIADYYGDIEPKRDYDTLRANIYLSPSISLDIHDNFDLYASANLFYRPIGEPTYIEPENILREGYLRYHNDLFSLYAGQRIVNWGKVDFYSPINVINPVDLTVISMDNIQESKLPTPMVDLVISPHYTTTLEIIYEPFLRPYYTPDEERTIAARILTVDIDTDFIHKNPAPLSIPSHSFFVALNHWSYWFDILLSYSWYLDPHPDFDISEITQTIEEGTFFNRSVIRGTGETTYNRAQLIGLGFSINIDDWGIDGEAGLKITKDWEGVDVAIKNSEFVGNLQFNKTFFTFWFTQFNIIYRHIINYHIKPESELHATVLDSLNSEFQDTFLQPTQDTIYGALHLHRFFINEKLYTGANLGVGIPINNKDYEEELFISPRLTYTLNDITKFQGGADFFLQGEEAGYIGRNKDKDNFYIKVILQF